MKIVSRASRSGLLVGFLRILCNEQCITQRFHTEEHDHTCRVGCPNEPDSLTHYNECPRLYNIFSFWRHVTVLSQRNHFSTTWSLECSCGAFNVESWQLASLTPSSMPIISTATTLTRERHPTNRRKTLKITLLMTVDFDVDPFDVKLCPI